MLYEAVGLKSPHSRIQDIPLLLSSIGWGSRILHFQLTILENGRFIHLSFAKDTGVPVKGGCGSRALDIAVRSFKGKRDTLADSSMCTRSNWAFSMLIDFEKQIS